MQFMKIIDAMGNTHVQNEIIVFFVMVITPLLIVANVGQMNLTKDLLLVQNGE